MRDGRGVAGRQAERSPPGSWRAALRAMAARLASRQSRQRQPCRHALVVPGAAVAVWGVMSRMVVS